MRKQCFVAASDDMHLRVSTAPNLQGRHPAAARHGSRCVWRWVVGVQLQHDGEDQGVGGTHGLHPLCRGPPHPPARPQVGPHLSSTACTSGHRHKWQLVSLVAEWRPLGLSVGLCCTAVQCVR